ncbi:hypothetical protein LIA77_05153 [Sarocladium implicatum]|jgi:hypothetical protein|nr:hypothetical protein LIA77_05153 [Sarocladium implicatum]
MRKPELRFFQSDIRLTGLQAREAMFVDDKEENIIAAHSLGFRGAVHLNNAADSRRILLNALDDSVDACCEFDLCHLFQNNNLSDGSLEIGWLCQAKMKIGSRGLTTALAVHAIEGNCTTLDATRNYK